MHVGGPHWGSSQRTPDSLAGFKGPTSQVPTYKRREKGAGEGRGVKMIYATGTKNLASPLDDVQFCTH